MLNFFENQVTSLKFGGPKCCLELGQLSISCSCAEAKQRGHGINLVTRNLPSDVWTNLVPKKGKYHRINQFLHIRIHYWIFRIFLGFFISINTSIFRITIQ